MIQQNLIYLCGPITGCSYEECQARYRETIEAYKQAIFAGSPGSNSNGIPDSVYEKNFISPLRGKDYLRGESSLGKQYEQYILSGGKAIVARDYFDVDRAHILLANFLGAERVSIGSVCEVTRAHTKGKLIILVMENDGSNPHDHPFLTEAASFRVTSLPAACHVIQYVLSTGL